MQQLNRRAFVQLSAGALLTTVSPDLLAQNLPSFDKRDGVVRVSSAQYLWEYRQADDSFRLHDSHQRLIVAGKMQPSVVVAPSADPTQRLSTPGTVNGVTVGNGTVTIEYTSVNGAARVLLAWRFDAHGIWTDPVVYDTLETHDVVSLHYFTGGGSHPLPTLNTTFVIAPGISESSAVSPVVKDLVHLDTSVWLGRGSFTPGLLQQWGLPAHYFCGFSAHPSSSKGERDQYTAGRSDAFTCGLADLPDGDLFLQFHQGLVGPWVDYRSDLWKHLRGPGKLKLGATLVWALGSDYYLSIGAYYDALLHAGIIHRKQNSPRKTEIVLTPEFCTWGAQTVRATTGDQLTGTFLDELYQQYKNSGMKAGLFSIDDKWEGAYGNLVHSSTRLPKFENFLNQLRADGLKVGLWAAIMRCEQPADLGLTLENMLQKPDGQPFVIGQGGENKYYILDFTQPEVASVLTTVVRRFIRRYNPDVFKFDFGYELPAVGVAAPKDKTWSGERLMWKGLEVVINAMREENPDQVVMYYNLSPLFLDYFDLHSLDDLFLSPGDFDAAANQRFFFSSLLGKLGVPTYGSTGYDWSSAPSIWFDSAAMGTVGSLNDFAGDQEGEVSTPEYIAKYNGIANVLRPTSIFEIVPIDYVSQAASLGAHARTWARFEGGELVLLAYRPPIAGEEKALAAPSMDPRVSGAVHSVVPVVVASRGSRGIAQASELAIAPYGGGVIAIHRKQGRHAEVISHYFGGSSTTTKADVEDGLLHVTAVATNAAGKPLEWMQIRIS